MRVAAQARRPEQPPIGTDIAATQTAGVLATLCHTVLSTLRPARTCAYLGWKRADICANAPGHVCGRACGQLCGQLCGRMYGQGEGGGAAQCRHGIWVLGLASHFSHWPARRGRARAFAAAACVANAAAAIERIAFWL